jgi:flagellar motor protein MotB
VVPWVFNSHPLTLPNPFVVLLPAYVLQEAAANTRKLYSLHFWGITEQQTRNNKHALAAVAPYFQGCFKIQRAVQPAGALAQQQQQQAGQQLAGQQQGNQQQQQGQGPEQQLLLVVAAAALLGGWWQPTAQPSVGAAQQLAVQALHECLGQGPADAVAALVR